MGVIDEVYLGANNKEGWAIHDHSRTLPGYITVLHVSDGSESWQFECQSLGGYMHYITGPGWTRFFLGRDHAKVTLYSRDEGEEFNRVDVMLMA